jgi:hypothetical protein
LSKLILRPGTVWVEASRSSSPFKRLRASSRASLVVLFVSDSCRASAAANSSQPLSPQPAKSALARAVSSPP